jgi:hypothetical protein
MPQEKLALSNKYSKGYALQFDITSRDDFQSVKPLIKKLITLRT